MKLSHAIAELQSLLEREGDIPFVAEGWFREACEPRFHQKHRTATTNLVFHPDADGGDANRGEKIILVSHL